MAGKSHGKTWTYEQRQMPRGRWLTQGRRDPDEKPDEIAVERLLRGFTDFNHSPADRDAALDKADVGGATAREVASRLGCTMRTVQRRRAERRKLGIDPPPGNGRTGAAPAGGRGLLRALDRHALDLS